MNERWEELKRLIGNYSGQSACKSMTMSTPLTELGLDFLDVIELCMDVEEEFSIEVPHEQEQEWETVGDIVRCIEDLRNPLQPLPAAEDATQRIVEAHRIIREQEEIISKALEELGHGASL